MINSWDLAIFALQSLSGYKVIISIFSIRKQHDRLIKSFLATFSLQGICDSYTLLPHMWYAGCCHDKQASSVDSHKIKQRTQARQRQGERRVCSSFTTRQELQRGLTWAGVLQTWCRRLCNSNIFATISLVCWVNLLSVMRPFATRNFQQNCRQANRNWTWIWHYTALRWIHDPPPCKRSSKQAVMERAREGWLCAASASNWLTGFQKEGAAATQGIIKSTFISIFHAKVAIGPLSPDRARSWQADTGHGRRRRQDNKWNAPDNLRLPGEALSNWWTTKSVARVARRRVAKTEIPF